MRILIATGIFEPESGGPAVYAATLARKLAQAGDMVTVLSYSDLAAYDFDTKYPFALVRVVRKNKIINRIRFFFAALPLVWKSDVVYTLDWFAAGLPIALAAKLLRKKYFVRVGGDYLWEQKYLQSGEPPVTLREFYEHGLYQRRSYAFALRIILFVLRGASKVIFNSADQAELYKKYIGLAQTAVICNAVPRSELADIKRASALREFVFWGRLIVMKNIDTLIRAFAQARIPENFTLTIIGDGPERTRLIALAKELRMEGRIAFVPAMPHREALLRVKDARAFILPSWTDIAPNQVYEALAIGLPALVTSENYLPIREELPETIDPHSAQDIAKKIEMLVDDSHYQYFAARFRDITIERTWDDVVREHRELFVNA